MSITHWPSEHYGLLLSNTAIMPYFTRAAALRGDKNLELNDDEIKLCRDLSLDEFARMAANGELSPAFWDHDNLESFEDDLNRVGELEGLFIVLKESVPEGASLEPIDGYAPEVRQVFEYEDVVSLPLKNRKTVFAAAYPDYTAMETEIREKLAEMNIEIPADFPLWTCIGQIVGVIYDS